MFTDDVVLKDVPWPLLIRARTGAEVDAVISSVVLARMAEVGSVETLTRVAEAAEAARGASTEPATAEQKLDALSAIADFEDWYCGNGFRPRPRHVGVLDGLSDPVVGIVADGARALVRAGSPALQKTLGEALEQV
jgi:hypothetical protein